MNDDQNDRVSEKLNKNPRIMEALDKLSPEAIIERLESKMKTEEEIRGVLASHSYNVSMLLAQPMELAKVAKSLGWTEERLKGYQEGVQYAYKWALGEIQCRK